MMCEECWTCQTDKRIKKLENASCADDKSLVHVINSMGQLREDVADLRARTHESMLGIYDWIRRLEKRILQMEGPVKEDPFRVGDYQLCNSEDGDMEVTKDVGVGTRIVARWCGTGFSFVSPVDKGIIGDPDFWLVVGQGYKLKYDDE